LNYKLSIIEYVLQIVKTQCMLNLSIQSSLLWEDMTNCNISSCGWWPVEELNYTQTVRADEMFSDVNPDAAYISSHESFQT